MANTYNYMEAIKADIRNYLEYEMDIENDILTGQFEDRDEIEEYLNDTLWTEDSITGNASGSYTFSTYEAEENLCHNLDLLGEALQEFGCGPEYLMNEGAEAADVTIRCYLLGQAIAEVLDEIEDEIEAAIETREEDDEEEATA
jgi:hypothetical protein